MFLFVGLGNIGKKYIDTPHNTGFEFIDKFRDYLGYDNLYSVGAWEVEKLAKAEVCSIRKGNNKAGLLVKPQTFMNLSGFTVSKLVRMFDLDVVNDLVLIHDDLDLELGTFKIQKGIGPKGHKGVNDVMSLVGGAGFLRVRIGIETRQKHREGFILPGEDFVLRKYTKAELLILHETIADAIKSLRSVIQF